MMRWILSGESKSLHFKLCGVVVDVVVVVVAVFVVVVAVVVVVEVVLAETF